MLGTIYILAGMEMKLKHLNYNLQSLFQDIDDHLLQLH